MPNPAVGENPAEIEPEVADRVAKLTEGQLDCLRLVDEHLSSKEIAVELGISPHTVDQRIFFAKEKLGAASRNEAAATYRRLVAISGRTTYEKTRIAGPAPSPQTIPGLLAGQVLAFRRQEMPQPEGPALAELDFRVVPELFDGRYGTLVRLGVIIAIAVFLVILVLGGLAILSQLSEMLAG